jgi:integrase/recombinase XerD
MLRELFPKGYVRYERSGFVQDLEEFGAWLEATGYSRQRTRRHLFRLSVSLKRLTRAKPYAAYTVAQLESAFDVARVDMRRSIFYRATRRAYERFLSSQGRLVTVPVDAPFGELRHRYRQELLDLRGLSRETIEQHERTIGDFLSHMLRGGRTLDSLASRDVDRYLALKGQTVGRHRLQHVVAHLRAFLGFCRANGQIHQPLEVIDTVRLHGDELPPRAMAWSSVQALLRSIDRSSRSGWRDYAILHLMAHYGLRPSEIVSLRLDSVDWSSRILKVEQRKTRSTLALPLADRTVSILRSYLRHGRPTSPHPQLFLRARCPAGTLSRHAIADLFEKRAALGGLSTDGYSAYSLRHAFAMRLLKRGVGLKAIGDLLGHRDLTTTCQYLRLQLDMLRSVALPVPVQREA